MISAFDKVLNKSYNVEHSLTLPVRGSRGTGQVRGGGLSGPPLLFGLWSDFLVRLRLGGINPIILRAFDQKLGLQLIRGPP